MIARCADSKDRSYASHGGRGIKVDPAWLDFKVFEKDMGRRPKGKTLDRINVDGHYSRQNCRWATLAQQRANRRDSVKLTFHTDSKAPSEWADILAKRTGKEWTVKVLKYILNFMTFEQIISGVHSCQRTPAELSAELKGRLAERATARRMRGELEKEAAARRMAVQAEVQPEQMQKPTWLPPPSKRSRASGALTKPRRSTDASDSLAVKQPDEEAQPERMARPDYTPPPSRRSIGTQTPAIATSHHGAAGEPQRPRAAQQDLQAQQVAEYKPMTRPVYVPPPSRRTRTNSAAVASKTDGGPDEPHGSQ